MVAILQGEGRPPAHPFLPPEERSMPSAALPIRLLVPIVALCVTLALPPEAQARQLAVGVRAGTLGLGGEAALGLGERLAARVGIGVFPVDLPEITVEELDFLMTPPDRFITAGLDLYPFGSGLRLMGGMIFRSGDIGLGTGVEPGDRVGDIVVDRSGSLSGALVQGTSGPFVGVGFGKHTAGGFGLFLDLGVAFLGSGRVEITGSENLLQLPGMQAEIDRVAAEVEDQAGRYLELWPVLSVGFKLGLGGR
jgi:hypothetical protein